MESIPAEEIVLKVEPAAILAAALTQRGHFTQARLCTKVVEVGALGGWPSVGKKYLNISRRLQRWHLPERYRGTCVRWSRDPLSRLPAFTPPMPCVFFLLLRTILRASAAVPGYQRRRLLG